MSSQLRTAFGTACVVTSLLAAAAASAQSKRMWVDPPKDLSSQARPAAVPAPRDTSANKSAQPVALAAPAVGEIETKASVTTKTTAKPKAAPTRRAAPARAKARTRVAKPASARSGRVAAASRKARPQKDGRLASGGGPLVVMYLQTIELPDGRRYQVLTPRGQ